MLVHHGQWCLCHSMHDVPVSFEGASHLQLISHGQGSPQHVPLIQDHSQPMNLHSIKLQVFAANHTCLVG